MNVDTIYTAAEVWNHPKFYLTDSEMFVECNAAGCLASLLDFQLLTNLNNMAKIWNVALHVLRKIQYQVSPYLAQ